MPPKVAIIGAGIAGLSAASYLQRNGFDTEIHELHDKPGGLCAAWERSGYTFDGCIHWLMGSGPSSNLHEIWKELGAGDLEYLEWDEHAAVRLASGDCFTVYTDPDRLEAELLRLGPEDGAVAREIARGVRLASRLDLPAAFDKLGLAAALRLAGPFARALPMLARDLKRPVGALAAQVQGPVLREALAATFGEAIDMLPLAALYMMLGSMAKRSSGYPLGGSLAFARAIEAKYLSLGGAVKYRSRVDEILVEGGRAVGLRGAGGEVRADYVVSAADAYDTLKRLLGGRYAMPILDRSFEGKGLQPYPSLIFVGLGLKRPFAELPHSLSLPLAAPLVLEGGALRAGRLTLRTFNFDPAMAPAGKVAATVMLETRNFDYWMGLAEGDPAAYAAEKRRTGDAVIAALDSALPGLAEAVEVVDVATPRTFARYTNNWLGSYEGWLPGVGSFGKRIPRKVPGLDRLRLVGQWVNPGGGLPPCGIDGRNLAKELCRLEGRRFRPD